LNKLHDADKLNTDNVSLTTIAAIYNNIPVHNMKCPLHFYVRQKLTKLL